MPPPTTCVPSSSPLPHLHNPSNTTQNYNSGIPSSIAPSIASGSTISRNQTPTPIYTPSASSYPPPSHQYQTQNPYDQQRSPPPSFHTISSPGTPRPSRAQSIRTLQSGSGGQELWGVAPSTAGEAYPETENGTRRSIGTSNDALATIAGLRNRVEWLEESIGRLLIEKDASKMNSGDVEEGRNNCMCILNSFSYM